MQVLDTGIAIYHTMILHDKVHIYMILSYIEYILDTIYIVSILGNTFKYLYIKILIIYIV